MAYIELGTHITNKEQTALYATPAQVSGAVMGLLKGGTRVQVTREWVNKEWNEVRVVDQDEPAFQALGIQGTFYFVKHTDLTPLLSTIGSLNMLPKIYVAPEPMSKLERVVIPDWTKNTGIPFYHKGDAEYWISVKLPYTQCVGGPNQLQQKNEEAKKLAVERLFRHYNVNYNQDTKEEISDFINGFLSCHVHDYHMDDRPNSKLMMLVKVRAIYFNWQRRNLPTGPLRSTKLKDLPAAASKIILDPDKYESEVEKMAKYMAKMSLDMQREDVLIPGVNLMREARRLRQFVSSLRQFLKDNEFEKTKRKAARSGGKLHLEIGFSENHDIVYVAFRNQRKRARRKAV